LAESSDPDSIIKLQEISCLKLPDRIAEQSSRLRSVVQGDGGNVYYSDEFSHTVGSLDKSGRLRWIQGGKGTEPGKFYYPMGIALGLCSCKGKLQECLCACDSWNNRVQVFRLDGQFLGCWTAAGDTAFREICDICFIKKPFPQEDGYWLVLDRGNHRLCALDLGGELKFQVGQAFDPKIENQWMKEGLEPLDDPVPLQTAHAYLAFDPLFYPTRILGRSEHSIYLYEPFSGRLKQPFLGNLFPLEIQRPVDSEWLAANDWFFVAWDQKRRRLSWLDHRGEILYEAEVEIIELSNAGYR
jgi:hypothetical protein